MIFTPDTAERKSWLCFFVGSDPFGEGMDLFWKELFVNNLFLTQKTGRI